MGLPPSPFKLEGQAPGGASGEIPVKPPTQVSLTASPQGVKDQAEAERVHKEIPLITLRERQPMVGFKTLQSSGYYPYASQYPDTSKYSLHRHEFWNVFPQFIREDLNTAPLFAGVNPDKVNVMKSLMKFDQPPSFSFRDDPLWAEAQRIVNAKMSVVFQQHTILFEEAVDLVDVTKAPGFPWNVMGYRTKGAAMLHPQFRERVEKGREIPIYKTSPKHEWKEIADILQHKIRTFIIEPVDSVVQKKILYHNQNESLKNYWWSQYGMTPFRGGFNAMAEELLDSYGIESGDIVGYDRRFPVMREIYKARNEGLETAGASEENLDLAKHQAECMEKIRIIFPDGEIVELSTGGDGWSDPSGQNNTTPDNILGGCYMHTFKYLCAVRDLQKTEPEVKVPYEWFSRRAVNIFGDDYVAGVPYAMKLVLNEEWARNFWKSKFGYEIRDFQAGLTSKEELSKHKFLGGKFHEYRGCWIPLFSEDRLRDSFCWNIDSMDTSATLNKLYSLIVLSFPHAELFANMATAYRYVLRHLAKTNVTDNQVAKAILRGAPDPIALVSFYTGRESISFEPGPFLSELMDGWRKKIINFQSAPMDGTSIKRAKGAKGKHPQSDGARLISKAKEVQKAVQKAAAGGPKEGYPARAKNVGIGRGGGDEHAKGGPKGNGKLAGLGAVSSKGLRSDVAGSGPKTRSIAVTKAPPGWVQPKVNALVAKLKAHAISALEEENEKRKKVREDLASSVGLPQDRIKSMDDLLDGSTGELPSWHPVNGYKGDDFDAVQRKKWEANAPLDRLCHVVTDPALVAQAKTASGISQAKKADFIVHDMPLNPMSETHDVMTVHMDDGKPKHQGSERTYTSEGVEESGDELIQAIAIPPAIGGVTSVIPEGGILALTPVNPRFIDGSRVSKTMEMFDQFRFLELEFGYEHVANAFQAGQLIMAFVNQFSDAIVVETGFQAARDLYARTGKAMFQVTQDRRCKIAHPLLQWYYTATATDADLEMPGFLVVVTTQPLSNATALSTPLGTLTMHYRMALRSPTVEGVTTQQFAAASASLSMTAATGGNGVAIAVAAASSGLPAGLTQLGVVNYATIVACDDSGPGAPAWRNWADGSTQDQHVMEPGNVLIWRAMKDGAGIVRLLFFPNLDAAIGADTYGVGPVWEGLTVMVAGTKGFKLWNVNGFNVEGSNE